MLNPNFNIYEKIVNDLHVGELFKELLFEKGERGIRGRASK
jgi:hypothetical protein